MQIASGVSGHCVGFLKAGTQGEWLNRQPHSSSTPSEHDPPDELDHRRRTTLGCGGAERPACTTAGARSAAGQREVRRHRPRRRGTCLDRAAPGRAGRRGVHVRLPVPYPRVRAACRLPVPLVPLHAGRSCSSSVSPCSIPYVLFETFYESLAAWVERQPGAPQRGSSVVGDVVPRRAVHVAASACPCGGRCRPGWRSPLAIGVSLWGGLSTNDDYALVEDGEPAAVLRHRDEAAARAHRAAAACPASGWPRQRWRP